MKYISPTVSRIVTISGVRELVLTVIFGSGKRDVYATVSGLV